MEEQAADPKAGENLRVRKLVVAAQQRAPMDAVAYLDGESDELIAQVLSECDAAAAIGILVCFSGERSQAIRARASEEKRSQWIRNEAYPEGSVGRLMEQPSALFRASATVGEAIEVLRGLANAMLVTYGYVTGEGGQLRGVLVMRDLLLARSDQTLEEIMVESPFSLYPEMSVSEATKLVLHRHYPVYPVCSEDGRLMGLIRGYVLFEEQAIELSAQPGRMVGVEDEERVTTPWWRCLRFRHPWLQLNLVTAFMAASVVGVFQHTIDQVVLLAVFLPVLAGQSGNTGLQSLAVTLRGMTLGELKERKNSRLVAKEALVGLLNGILVGLTAGLGMYLYAGWMDNSEPFLLGLVVFLAMVSSCVLSGVSGTLIPIGLKRLGVDPATASSIFLTTLTDLVSMGLFLWLATLLLL
jgi:magnesium transporter